VLLQCKCGFSIEDTHPDAPQRFYRKWNDRTPTGKSSWCSMCVVCMKEYKRQYYLKHREESNAYQKKLRADNIEHYLKVEAAQRLAHKASQGKDTSYTPHVRKVKALDPKARYIHRRCVQWKSSATKRSLDWNLDTEYVLSLWEKQRGKCLYTGRPLTQESNRPNTVSLDRVDSGRGYVRGNVVLCETAVNILKFTATVGELEDIVRALHGRIDHWKTDLESIKER
jgi:hypothetical protein